MLSRISLTWIPLPSAMNQRVIPSSSKTIPRTASRIRRRTTATEPNDRSAGAAGGSHETASREYDIDPAIGGETLREPSGHIHRAVAAAGAAHSNGELRLAFGKIARQQEIDQIGDLGKKRRERIVLLDEGCNRFIVAGFSGE